MMSSLLSCAEVSNSIMTTFPTSNILGVRICQCHDEARLLKRSTSFQTCHDIVTRMLRSQCHLNMPVSRLLHGSYLRPLPVTNLANADYLFANHDNSFRLLLIIGKSYVGISSYHRCNTCTASMTNMKERCKL